MLLVFYSTDQRRQLFHSYQRSELRCTLQFYIHVNKVFAIEFLGSHFFNLLFVLQKEKEEVVKRCFYSLVSHWYILNSSFAMYFIRGGVAKQKVLSDVTRLPKGFTYYKLD